MFCYWQQLGNKWADIAKLVGRSENWVKNYCRKLIKREEVNSEDEKIGDRIGRLIERLKSRIESSSSIAADLPPIADDLDDEDLSNENFVTAREDIKDTTPKRTEATPSKEGMDEMDLSVEEEMSAGNRQMSVEQLDSGGEGQMEVDSEKKPENNFYLSCNNRSGYKIYAL
eukprot:TRINITY_DN1966_c0_g2_i8.p1 TRINITY_DN1966_c0_g2~~TRINITY_DN1966_c0_g2_i8.p1  ORF type:complete len:171 (-),score=24.02 TRINITY_DN1966_c0_g2_i8:198-710(-)